MTSYLRSITLLAYAGLLFIGCSTKEPDGQNAKINDPDGLETDIEEHDEDIQEDEQEDVEDINEESNRGLQNVQLQALEGMAEFSWDLPEDSTLTDIRITASPAALMWGDSDRIVDPGARGYLFDKLVNDIPYSFEVQAFADDEAVGDPFVFETTPFSRPLLAVRNRGIAPIDSITKQQASGWDTYVEQNITALRWSPDGTKLFVMSPAGDWIRCTILDRATREEIQLPPLAELESLCGPIGASWSPDSRRIAFTHLLDDDSIGTRVTYSVFDTQTGEIESDWPGLFDIDDIARVVSTLNWSPDGKWLAFNAQYGSNNTFRLVVVNTDTKEIEPDWVIFPDGFAGDGIGTMEWSPDSKRLAITYSAAVYNPPLHPYVVVNAETKEVETDWPEYIQPSPPATTILVPTRVRWSPDGEILVLALFYGSTSERDSIQAIDTTTRENISGWPTDWPQITDIAWTHDSQRLAISAYTSPYLLIVDRSSKKIVEEWTPLTQRINGISWSPQHDPPTAPTDIELTRDESSARLSWNPPDDGKILDYRITIEPQDQVDGLSDFLIFDPAATEYTVQGLNSEADYTFSISAISLFGVGEPATYSAF